METKTIISSSERQTLYNYLRDSRDLKDVFLQFLLETGARVSESFTATHRDNQVYIKGLKSSLDRTVTISDNLKAKLNATGGLNPRLISQGKSQRRTLTRHWHSVSVKVLGRRVKLHALRHAAFSDLYKASKDLMLVKQWAGHKSVNSTLVYLHLDNLEQANTLARSLLSE